MLAVEPQFRVLEGSPVTFYKRTLGGKPSLDLAPLFQFTTFSSISCAALRHGSFSLTQMRGLGVSNGTVPIDTRNRPY